MGTVITGELALRRGGYLSTRAGRSFAVIGVVGCLTVAALVAPLMGAGAAFSAQADIISVDRTHKGDRLPLSPKAASKVSSPAVTTLAKPPLGCEPAFSRVVDPDRAHIFGRCIS
jgi:hypothetical protein